MKKIMAVCMLFVLTPLLFGQQNDEPVYVIYNDMIIFAIEYAKNTISKNDLKKIEPYLRNGRLYFASSAWPLAAGNLSPGFKFEIGEQFKDIPAFMKLKPPGPYTAVYSGGQKDKMDPSSPVFIAGFAEKGKITATRVFSFSDTTALQQWAATVKIAK
jgi:hypothetical protein